MLRSFKTQNYDFLKSFVRRNQQKEVDVLTGNECLSFEGYYCHRSPAEKIKKVKVSLE
jgi:hypothetical protein